MNIDHVMIFAVRQKDWFGWSMWTEDYSFSALLE
jgi:hypothetical protein